MCFLWEWLFKMVHKLSLYFSIFKIVETVLKEPELQLTNIADHYIAIALFEKKKKNESTDDKDRLSWNNCFTGN